MTQVGWFLAAFLALLSVAIPAGRMVVHGSPPDTPTPAIAQTPAMPQAPDTSVPPAGRGRGGRGGAARVVPIPDAPALPHAIVENPLPLPSNMSYGVVASVAVNPAGHAFVYHRGDSPLLEFDAAGRFVGPVPGVTATRAHSVRIDADDNFWLVDVGDHTVTKRSRQGQLLMTLGTRGVAGSGDADAAAGRFNLPSDVGIAPNGDIFISQGEAAGPDPRVIRFDRNGRFLNTWSLAYAEGPASDPHALAVGRDGLVYVADRRVMRVRVFRPDGTPVRDIQLQHLVCGIDIDDSGQMWISTGTDGLVMRVEPSGRVAGFAGRRGTGPGEMSEAHMIAVAATGDVYVADTVGQKVVKLAVGAVGAQTAPPSPAVDHYRLVPGFVAERFNDEGMALGTGFSAPNPWGAYTAYLLATNAKRQRTWRIENYLPNAASGTAQGSSMYLFEGSTRALLVDTAQNTPDEPGKTDLKTVVRHLLGQENDGRTPRPSPVDFVVAITHRHGDHTGKNATLGDRVLYYPELDWPAQNAPANYVPIKEGGGSSPHGSGQAAGDIDLGNRTIVAIDLHAHTPGSTGYLDRENRMIATGDAIGSAYVWAHFGTMVQYHRTVRHLQDVLRPLPHVDVLPAHFYQVKYGARGRAPVNGRPLDKTYVDDQVRTAEGILAGTVVSDPYRAVGRNAVIATVASAQIVWTMGNVESATYPLETPFANAWRAVSIPGPLPPSPEGDRFAGLRTIRSRVYLLRGRGDQTAYVVVGSERALLVGTGGERDATALRRLAEQLAGSVPLAVAVTSGDAGQVGGLATFGGLVHYLPTGAAAAPAASSITRLATGTRITLGTDTAGRPLALEAHEVSGGPTAAVALLSVNDRVLFAGDGLGMQGPDGGLVLTGSLADFATRLKTFRHATDGKYDVVYTARNFQWFTSPAWVDQVQEAVARGLGADTAVWLPVPDRPGARLVRSTGTPDVVASIVVAAP